ncbi:hypothetical protein Moror_2158 [Moniliophthora roreri MCA 2997]|uniref:Reverse transcriptase-rnase h-integrase n=1 Tax=Moniliophthora roreri (strain MCA 2997) TaxID=1381753 RepID=V2WA63_MONRO|nr:hypothetical protein Moror_2158 [Moniliophthora roreri MCA 2997]
MLPDSLFVNVIDVDLQDRLKNALGNDDFHRSMLEALLNQGIPPIKSSLSDWKFDDDILFYKGQPFGYPGQYGTIDLVSREFWWPGMAKFIKAFVDGCAPCQQMKVITMDLITDLPESDGLDSIMVVVDHLSMKGVIFIPCTKKLDATKAAELLFQYVYKRYGLAERIISDRDPRFAVEVFQEMARLLGIKHSMSTAYHPQTDGETERVNQEVKIYLQFFCGKQQAEWSKHLHMAEFAHNNRTHSVTHHSPFFLTMGEETSVMIEVARRWVIEQGKRRRDTFEKGQKVWLEGKNLDFGYPTKKLSPKREGPFEIEEVMGPVTYKLKLLKQWRIHPVFHVGLLSPYKETDEHRANYLEPPLDIVDGHEEFEIEAIIGHKPRKDLKKFLVSWKGYDSSHNEWKKKAELEHTMELYLDQGSLSFNLHSRPLPSPPTGIEDSERVHYNGLFAPSSFELLYLVNTSEHDNMLRLGTAASPVHHITVDRLIHLHEQCAALDWIVQEMNTYSANLAYNATAGAAGSLILQGPITVLLPPAYSHNDNPPNTSDTNFEWHMQPMLNEYRTPPNWHVTNSNVSPPSPHPALVYLGHLFEPNNEDLFIPNDSPPPLQVLPPSSTPILPVPPATMTPLMTDPSLSNTFHHLNPEAPPCMPPPLASEPPLLQIQVLRLSNPIWRVSTLLAFRDVTTVTPLPQYRSMQTVSSTPIFNHSESSMPTTDTPQSLSLANQRLTPVPPRTLIRDPTTQSVWDDDDLIEASLSEPSSSPTDSDMTDKVYEYLSALCAEWHTTAAENAQATVVKFVGQLHLVTSLEIVVSNDGQRVTPTPSSMETENSDSATAATENAEQQYEWVYSGRQELFREVTLSDGTVARLEFRP